VPFGVTVGLEGGAENVGLAGDGRTPTIVGKKLVVILGQKKAVAIAVGNVSGQRRWSKLQEWLMKNR
jgi:hypothetical protein